MSVATYTAEFFEASKDGVFEYVELRLMSKLDAGVGEAFKSTYPIKLALVSAVHKEVLCAK